MYLFYEGGFFMSKMFSKLFEIRTEVWVVVALVILISIAGAVILSRRKDEMTHLAVNKTRKLVYGGVCIALAFILSYIRLYRMPQGGSITPGSMIPIILYSIIFGPAAGIAAGVSYGFLQFFQDGGIIHWAQLFLDYPLAFGFLGIAGIVPLQFNIRTRIVTGTLIAILGRGLMHVLSGAIFFAEFAGDANPWLYSIIYNGTFLGVEAVLAITIAVMLSYTHVYESIKQV